MSEIINRYGRKSGFWMCGCGYIAHHSITKCCEYCGGCPSDSPKMWTCDKCPSHRMYRTIYVDQCSYCGCMSPYTDGYTDAG